MYRKSMSRKKSGKLFTRTAMRVKNRNFATVMRGGYRI
jgi:hypothetical protein